MINVGFTGERDWNFLHRLFRSKSFDILYIRTSNRKCRELIASCKGVLRLFAVFYLRMFAKEQMLRMGFEINAVRDDNGQMVMRESKL